MNTCSVSPSLDLPLQTLRCSVQQSLPYSHCCTCVHIFTCSYESKTASHPAWEHSVSHLPSHSPCRQAGSPGASIQLMGAQDRPQHLALPVRPPALPKPHNYFSRCRYSPSPSMSRTEPCTHPHDAAYTATPAPKRPNPQNIREFP